MTATLAVYKPRHWQNPVAPCSPRVDLRFYIDPETEQPHIYGHTVDEQDVEDVLARPSAFVITAYPVGFKVVRALRRGKGENDERFEVPAGMG